MFLTQFMRSQGLQFLNVISWIFSSKNTHLVFLTVPLNVFQSLICLEVLYFDSADWYSSFHYSFECFVILMHFECFYHKRFEILINSWTASSSDSLSINWELWILLTLYTSSEINIKSSLLTLMMVHLLSCMNSSIIWILTTRGVKFTNGGLSFSLVHFSFLFSFCFIFLFSIFRTTRVRVDQSRCHTSHNLIA